MPSNHLAEQQTWPKVIVVILNWNGGSDTTACIASVQEMDYQNYQIVVIDNGSVDGSADLIARNYPEIAILRNSENLGYAGGNNVGIRFALEQNADYVWLLNNDTQVRSDALRLLTSRAELADGIGLLSPLIRDYDAPHNIQFTGAVANLRKRHFVTVQSAEDLSRRDVETVLWGTALLIKADLIRIIGLLDERYFAYQEDIDYSIRSIEAGFKNVLHTEAVVYHKSANSSGGNYTRFRQYLLMRNEHFIWRSRVRGLERVVYWPRYFARALEQSTMQKLAGRDEAAVGRLDGAWSAFCGDEGPWRQDRRMPKVLRTLLTAHPYFWISLFRGEFPQIVTEVAARMVQRTVKYFQQTRP
jgi:GT2 family glycosyltransferase